ncbi:MAG: PAS domain-containing protein [Verrucomicrobia bacterium]|nr:PAS domain-containing protein [Verrucomicrobiota bacterium]
MPSSLDHIRTHAVSQQQDAPTAELPDADLPGILDSLDIPIIVVARDCKVARFNQAAADALGFESSDIGRLPCNSRLIGEQDIQILAAEVIACGTPSQCEIRNGDRWFQLRIAPYCGANRQIEGAVLTFTNVTAFRASLAQAIYEREYTKTIINTVAQPLVVVDADLQVQTGNRAFYTLFGLSRDATRGARISNLANHGWNSLALWASIKENLLQNSEFETIEVEGDFPGIGRRTVLLDAHRLDRAGQMLMLIGLRDITAQKLQEATLERIVDERTVALRETVGELEAFSYSIAHDMRAPLRGMQGFAGILAEDYANVLDSQGMDYLGRIANSARRLDHLIQDVLNYSKIAKGQVVIAPLELDRVMHDVVDTYPNWHLPHADVQIQGTLPMVMGNEAFLTQCISNLVSNAIKFVLPGRVPRVRIWAEEVSVLPPGSKDKKHDEPNSIPPSLLPLPQVRVYFEDNGIGIAPEKHPRIFRMFERIHPTTEYEGTGIGLTIARRAVERMGGEIGFDSQLNHGSKFWIQLNRA